MKKKVKISDIARHSGVSASTVLLVLNDRPGISQDTRSRVLDVAEKLEYPFKPAVTFGKNVRLSSVGMVIKTDPDIVPQANPFYSKVIVGIEDASRQTGINLLFATLPVDENNCPIEVPQLISNELVDGLLMVRTFVDETITSISDQRTPPIVLVDGYSSTDSYDAVISDNFRAAYQAVDYLIDHGHRQIGLLGG